MPYTPTVQETTEPMSNKTQTPHTPAQFCPQEV